MNLIGTTASTKSVFYTRSSNAGNSWTSPNDYSTAYETAIDSIGSAGNQEIFIALTTKTTSVVLIESNNGGETWTKPMRKQN
jgi:hypothetical protein